METMIEKTESIIIGDNKLSAFDVLNKLGSVVLIVKVNRNGNTLPVWANKKYTEATGFSINERNNAGFTKNNNQIIHQEDYDCLIDEIKSRIKEKQSEGSFIFRLSTKQGIWKWFFFNAKTMTINNNSNYLLCNGFELCKENQYRLLKYLQDNNQQRNKEILCKLTKTEKEIIKDIISGFSTREIANKRERSFETINNHKRNLFKKLQISKSSELVIFALENGIHPPIAK